MFINDKHKFVYVSATKSGSSSMVKRLQAQFGGTNLGNTKWEIPAQYKDYYSFIVVRLPYTRMVSWWNSVINVDGDRYGHKKELREHGLTESLSDFIRLWEMKGDYSQAKYVDINGGVDQIIHLEKIDEEFSSLPFVTNQAPMPHSNKQIQDSKHWSMLTDDFEAIPLINKIYHRDFELFNYEKINISS